MKYLFTSILFIIALSFSATSQILNPVKWTTTVEKTSDTEYTLIATATIDTGWHLYSQIVPDNGPIPTTFSFKGNTNYSKKGNTKEGKGHEVDDKIFNMKIKYFDKKASFKQRVKLKTTDSFEIKATVEFMVCNDSQCLPPKEVDLIFTVQ
ncbi:MAG TPA: cytochrome C biogenesis protein [Flavobacteriaceae bacterium]|jgi:thiol:disulfide interchange protein DsbD|nr:cytochrome C biogenesis protein [Flavobacteriaceae bacterium]HBS13229.1 cytochrome C biogenesis protein [Flavobacteriaceae bacterium]